MSPRGVDALKEEGPQRILIVRNFGQLVPCPRADLGSGEGEAIMNCDGDYAIS
jgi:hypothetical protein